MLIIKEIMLYSMELKAKPDVKNTQVFITSKIAQKRFDIFYKNLLI